ncbi:mechanosensitive ion channel family protein [Natronobiforma cellulositropha]|uniref:mechanosensitive ion channel family protein n=1 Tax=Natronobiforma cellulositropha TaxID=1679076 RepID=UPI0021D57659|nr:mechanosensitive ion channel family protein [Natronobiforma cellulositropha]
MRRSFESLRLPAERLVALETGVSTLTDRLVAVLESPWLVAIALVVLAWLGSKLVADRLRPHLQERVLRPSVTNAVLLVARVTVVVFALAPIAGLLGVRPRNVLLSVTVLSVVVGAILAPAARSYVAGFFVLLNRPYEVGDMVELVDRHGERDRGYVADVTLRYTKLVTLENASLLVPNESMRERDVTNRSADDLRERCSLEVSVTYEGDLDAAREALERSARESEGVVSGGPGIRLGSQRYPAEPVAFVGATGDDGIVLDLRFWLENPYRPLAVRSAVLERFLREIDGRNVDLAYPHVQHVFADESGRVPVSLETARSSEAATGVVDSE